MAFIVFYYVINYPFIKPPIYYEYSLVLNIFKIVLIALLVFRVFPLRRSTICIILLIETLYIYISIINGDSLKNILELSSVGLFIFLVYQLINKSDRLLEWHRLLWVRFAVFSSLSALSMYLIIFFYPDVIQNLGKSFYNYNYKYIPIVGFFIMTEPEIPRFCGYFFEPLAMGMFFALNIIAADYLIINKRKQRLFRLINFIGGVCTYSFGFFIFIFIYSIYVMLSSKSIRLAIVNVGLIGIAFNYYTEKILETYFSYKVVSRFNRLENALDNLQNISVVTLFHGFGNLVGMKIEAHSLDMYLHLVLFFGVVLGPFILLLYMSIWRKNTIVLIYALYYGLIFFYLFSPVISLGIFLVVTLSQKYYNQPKSITLQPT